MDCALCRFEDLGASPGKAGERQARDGTRCVSKARDEIKEVRLLLLHVFACPTDLEDGRSRCDRLGEPAKIRSAIKQRTER